MRRHFRPFEHNEMGGMMSMAEVRKFLQLARSRFRAPEEGVVFSMSQVLPWMEQHRKAEREGESKRT